MAVVSGRIVVQEKETRDQGSVTTPNFDIVFHDFGQHLLRQYNS